MMYCEKLEIAGKDVYIVNDHADALVAWANIRSGLEAALYLITLDHHTDTISAFRQLYVCSHEPQQNSMSEFSEEHVRQIEYSKPETVLEAVTGLRNDEHIDAAIRANIIRCAFVVCNGECSTPFSNREFERQVSTSKNNTYTVCPLCLPSCTKKCHDDQCVVLLADHAIDDIFLDECLKIVVEMRQAINASNDTPEQFILDIDLDYFGTRKAIDPQHTNAFYDLIRRAHAITVAMEPEYVKLSRLDGEGITSEFLLPLVLYHIREALTTSS